MHIPEGYLSPSTCGVFFAAAAPFWYIAVRRVKKLLNTRFVPLLAMFSAFSFIIMMFNLPLPGGTTGHALGVGIATIVLGPWAAIVAVSIALFIQAVFFGDGGILALGANCFNMAIIGSMVTYVIYRLLSAKAAINAPRRVVAAGIAGYVAVNAAALCAGVEFGIQPLLFHTASGAPLYAPYPLHIAIPAMMIPHLLVAGVAEAIITAGLVKYLQRTDISLLKLTTSNGSSFEENNLAQIHHKGVWYKSRQLWMGLSILMILTPLGLLSSGMAWGEWNAKDFEQPNARQQIKTATANKTPPAQAPEGLKKFSSFWTAPIPDYAPTFMKSEAFGYILSAMIGVGLIIFIFLLIGWLVQMRAEPHKV